MKLFNKYLLSIAVTLFCVAATNAHEIPGSRWKNKFEQVWRQSGTQATLNKVMKDAAFSPEDMNTFIYAHSEEIIKDRNWFFDNAFSSDTTEIYAEKINEVLKSKEKTYRQWAEEFKKEKSENTPLYVNWKTASLAVPSPSATTTAGPMCDNVDFENVNPVINWNFWLGNACDFDENSPLSCVSFTSVSYPITAPGIDPNRLLVETSGNDPNVGSALPKVAPGGTKSMRLENRVNGANIAKASITFTVDPTKPYYKYKYALVLEDPGGDHPKSAKPFFMVRLFEVATGNEITCARYYVAANSDAEKGDPIFIREFSEITPGSDIKYKPWSYTIVPLEDYANQQVRAEFVVSDCPWGGHLGYAYIDGECLDGQIIVGPCTGSTRDITAPDFFKSYHWSGPDIIGSNSTNKITVGEQGDYKVILQTSSQCNVTKILNVQPSCGGSVDPPCNISATVTSVGTCNTNNNLYNVSLLLNFTGVANTSIIKITDGKVEKFLFGPYTGPISVTLYNLVADGLLHNIKVQVFKSRFITNAIMHCENNISYSAPVACSMPTIACQNCIGSFAPTPGEKYILSAWVKDGSATATTTTFSNPYLELLYTVPGGPTSSGQLLGAGKIIEGWQRVYYEFTIPSNATAITVKLGSNAGDSYFDDIRIHPINGSMKSYVYDPISLKLVAILDENNYATLYEYDQEGALIRTKKETERGVVTISENRQNNPKK